MTEAIDTTSAAGRLMGHILAALAEFERSLIVERTQAGLKAAKRRGQKLGRKPSLSSEQVKHARELLDRGESPAASRQVAQGLPRYALQQFEIITINHIYE